MGKEQPGKPKEIRTSGKVMMSQETSSEEMGKIIKVKKMLVPLNSWETDEKVRQNLLAEVEQLGEVLVHSIKQDFYEAMPQKKDKKRKQVAMINSPLIKIGAVGVIGAEQLLKNEITDDDFIQDIIKLAEEDKHSISAAFALLGLEIAEKEGKYIPIILEVFESTHSKVELFSDLLIKHLGKVTWDERVVDSLIDTLSEGFFVTTIGTGAWLNYKTIYGTSYYASRALLEIGNERGVEAMVLSLLKEMIDTRFQNPKPKKYIQPFLEEVGKPVVKYLIQALSLDDPEVHVMAANCLGDIGDPTAFEALARNTTAEDYKTVNAAASTLGKLGDPRAIPVLLPLLGSELFLSLTVTNSLYKLKDVWQAPLFIDALKHEDQKVVLFAINALKIIQDKSAIEPLTALLESDNKKINKAAKKALKTLK